MLLLFALSFNDIDVFKPARALFAVWRRIVYQKER